MNGINQNILEKLKESKKARNLLAYTFDKSTDTIDRWISLNSPMLTTKEALNIISTELGINILEIINE